MSTFLFWILIIVFFLLQSWLCFRCRIDFLRWLPVVFAGILEGILWCSFYVKPRFSAYVIAVNGLKLLSALLLAWIIYGIVNYVQKHRK